MNEASSTCIYIYLGQNIKKNYVESLEFLPYLVLPV